MNEKRINSAKFIRPSETVRKRDNQNFRTAKTVLRHPATLALGHLGGSEVGVSVSDVAGDGLGGAGDGAVGDVSAADVVHGGGVGPVGVHGRVGVVGSLSFSRRPTSVHRCRHGLVRVRVRAAPTPHQTRAPHTSA